MSVDVGKGRSVVSEVPYIQVFQGPLMEESSRESMGVKWCFKCRTRAEFAWIVKAPVIDWKDDNSIAAAMIGPYAHSECANCKQSAGELFPGWSYRDDE